MLDDVIKEFVIDKKQVNVNNYADVKNSVIPSFPDVAVSSFISLGSRKEFSRSSFYMASFGRTLNDRRGLKTLEDPGP